MLVHDVIVGAPVVVGRRLVLGRPGATALDAVAAVPLAWAGVTLVVILLQVDAEAKMKHLLRVGLLRVLPGLGEDKVQGPRLDLVEGGELRHPQTGELLRVVRGLVLKMERGVLYEMVRS
jgi:hypothetical protein